MAKAGSLQAELEIKSPADKFFKVFTNQAHHVPNAASDKVHSVDVHEGDWETAGSVKQWEYTIDGKKEIFKEKIEVDEANKSFTMTAVGGHLLEQYKSYKIIAKVIPKGEGSLLAINIDYEKLKPEDTPPHNYLELVLSILKDVDAHVMENIEI
ncbi:hypothetical protein Tsubulata_015076 [Turnera subulata]|uniref:Bet v I/Major latex protein domain-containing protein n=1 Tax=Turnera subulata TaxID=218843 RepID=A0A9Q0G7Z7_9ROSI|nr:hypothetical protein Tsubulata_015076 [Turnera subulata]